MTDAELVKGCAEKVMGWAEIQPEDAERQAPYLNQLEKCAFWIIGGPGLSYFDGVTPVRVWNPLTSDADAFMLVDALMATGYGLTLHVGMGGAAAEIYCPRGPCERHGNPLIDRGHGSGEITDPDRRRAICLAALKAAAPAPGHGGEADAG